MNDKNGNNWDDDYDKNGDDEVDKDDEARVWSSEHLKSLTCKRAQRTFQTFPKTMGGGYWDSRSATLSYKHRNISVFFCASLMLAAGCFLIYQNKWRALKKSSKVYLEKSSEIRNWSVKRACSCAMALKMIPRGHFPATNVKNPSKIFPTWRDISKFTLMKGLLNVYSVENYFGRHLSWRSTKHIRVKDLFRVLIVT